MEAITVICFIWGILNIILFFKIWGMCNNVSSILRLLEEEKERNTNDDSKNAPQKKMNGNRESRQKKDNTEPSVPNVINPWK